MARSAQFDIIGIEEMKEILRELPNNFSLSRRRTILKNAFKPFLTAAKSGAPVESGGLRESIGTKTFSNNKADVFAGPLSDKTVSTVTGGNTKVDGFYAKFIEFGFTHVAWPEKGKRIDQGDYGPNRLDDIEPKPFLRPAFEQTKKAVLKEVERITRQRLKAIEKKRSR